MIAQTKPLGIYSENAVDSIWMRVYRLAGYPCPFCLAAIDESQRGAV